MIQNIWNLVGSASNGPVLIFLFSVFEIVCGNLISWSFNKPKINLFGKYASKFVATFYCTPSHLFHTHKICNSIYKIQKIPSTKISSQRKKGLSLMMGEPFTLSTRIKSSSRLLTCTYTDFICFGASTLQHSFYIFKSCAKRWAMRKNAFEAKCLFDMGMCDYAVMLLRI